MADLIIGNKTNNSNYNLLLDANLKIPDPSDSTVEIDLVTDTLGSDAKAQKQAASAYAVNQAVGTETTARMLADDTKVDKTTTVNNKALSSNITLSASDVGAVPTTRTVNNKALSSDITLDAADVGAVPTTRTINGMDLNNDRVIYAQDIQSKNLLQSRAKTTTLNGVTLTVNSDYSISCSGTATSQVEFFLVGTSWNDHRVYYLDKTKSYILSGSPSEDAYMTIFERNSGGTTVRQLFETGQGLTFTPSANAERWHCLIVIKTGVNATGLTFYPMIRLSSIEDSTYVPYAETNVALSNSNFNWGTISLNTSRSSGTTYTNYASRKFSNYDLLNFTIGASANDIRQSITIPSDRWVSGKTIFLNAAHNDGLTSVSGVEIVYVTDTSFLVRLTGSQALKYVEITGWPERFH